METDRGTILDSTLDSPAAIYGEIKQTIRRWQFAMAAREFPALVPEPPDVKVPGTAATTARIAPTTPRRPAAPVALPPLVRITPDTSGATFAPAVPLPKSGPTSIDAVTEFPPMAATDFGGDAFSTDAAEHRNEDTWPQHADAMTEATPPQLPTPMAAMGFGGDAFATDAAERRDEDTWPRPSEVSAPAPREYASEVFPPPASALQSAMFARLPRPVYPVTRPLARLLTGKARAVKTLPM